MSDLPPTPDAASPRRTDHRQGKPEHREVRVISGSRLHFGLLDRATPFGGVGVMIDRPETELAVTSARAFQYRGPDRLRAEAIGRRIVQWAGLPGCLPACRIEVVRHLPAHCGLGSGTQLSLAIAEGICRCLGIDVDLECLATQLAARGKRSAVGIHGYFQGGLIFEAAADAAALNPIQQRVVLPEAWCVAVLRPIRRSIAVHGEEEAETFAMLPPAPPAVRGELRRLAQERLMPAAAAGDFQAFCSAVTRYNRASGELFASIQGGPYNGREVETLIGWLIERGVSGVGQSSWGPGVFAWFESRQRAESVTADLPVGIERISLAHPKNQGRCLLARQFPPASGD